MKMQLCYLCEENISRILTIFTLCLSLSFVLRALVEAFYKIGWRLELIGYYVSHCKI